MWIRRLKVSDFAGIREADLELGVGLNVLFGPNELGKSTLVEAIRAALLLQDSSSTASGLADWHADSPPVVELTVEAEPERIWRIRKSFGSGREGWSYLEFSRDGRRFEQEARGREVDGRLAELLRWGLEAPGGRGRRKRGVPESFITTALLGRQDEVVAILERSLEDDPHVSGRELLTEALQAMGEDPVLAQALEIAQARVDHAFTATGQHRRGRDSPWIQLRDDYNEAQERVREMRDFVEQSESSRVRVEELQDELLQARSRLSEAERESELLESEWREQEQWRAAEQILRDANEEEARIRKLGEEVERCRVDCDAARRQQREAGALLAAAREELNNRKREMDDRASRVRELETGGGEQQRRIREQEAEKRLLRLQAHEGELAARIEQCERVGSLSTRADEIRNQIADLERNVEEAKSVLDDARTAFDRDEAAKAELQLRLRAARYLGLRAGVERVERTASEAEEHRAEAVRIEEELAEAQSELAGWAVPSAEEIDSLRNLHTKLRVAEEKLEVGLNVSVTPRPGVAFEIAADGEDLPDHASGSRFEVDARREVSIRIPSAATIEVRGGSRGLQEEAEACRRRWEEVARPIFDRSGLESLEEVEQLRVRGVERERHIEGLRSRAAEERARAEVPASVHEEGQRTRERCEQAYAAVEAALPEGERVEECLARLAEDASASAEEIEAEIEDLEGVLGERRELTQQLSEKVSGDSVRVESLQEELEAQQREIDAARQGLSHEWNVVLDQARGEIEGVRHDRESVETQLGLLRSEAAGEVTDAQEALSSSKEAMEEAQRKASATETEFQTAVGDLGRVEGTLTEKQEVLEREDLEAAAAAVKRASDALAALPTPEREITDEMRASAKGELEAATQAVQGLDLDLRQAIGALEQVGGGAVEEQAQLAEEALEAARDRQAEAEVEYGAWKLLLEVLKETEEEDAQNLGAALVRPVSERISGLTQDRYRGVAFDTELRARGVDMGDGLRGHASLSLGMREQLATILRLSIAEALGSFLVLDDQLVQSDYGRMSWLRELLEDAAEEIQIIVLTCRPGDYLRVDGDEYLAPAGGRGAVVDLSKALARTLEARETS